MRAGSPNIIHAEAILQSPASCCADAGSKFGLHFDRVTGRDRSNRHFGKSVAARAFSREGIGSQHDLLEPHPPTGGRGGPILGRYGSFSEHPRMALCAGRRTCRPCIGQAVPVSKNQDSLSLPDRQSCAGSEPASGFPCCTPAQLPDQLYDVPRTRYYRVSFALADNHVPRGDQLPDASELCLGHGITATATAGADTKRVCAGFPAQPSRKFTSGRQSCRKDEQEEI